MIGEVHHISPGGDRGMRGGVHGRSQGVLQGDQDEDVVKHVLYDEPPDDGGGAEVANQIAVDGQVGTGLHELMLSHEESAEI